MRKPKLQKMLVLSQNEILNKAGICPGNNEKVVEADQ